MSTSRTKLAGQTSSKKILSALAVLMLAMAPSYSYACSAVSGCLTFYMNSPQKKNQNPKYGDTRWISQNTGFPYGWAIIQKQGNNRLIKNLNGAKYPAKVTITSDSPYPSGWALRPDSNSQVIHLIYIADAPSGAKVDIAKKSLYPSHWAEILMPSIGNKVVNYKTIRNLSGNAFSKGTRVNVVKSSSVPSGWKVVSGNSLSYKILERI